MSSCCLQGFRWNGKPEGKEGKLANNNAYITGNNKDVAILVRWVASQVVMLYAVDSLGINHVDSKIYAARIYCSKILATFQSDLRITMSLPEIFKHENRA